MLKLQPWFCGSALGVHWFLVALSFSGASDGPLMAVREIGKGPVAMVSCELEVEVHASLGTAPTDINFFDAPHLYCVDQTRLCAMRAVTVVPVDRDPAATTARQRHCRD